MILTTTYKQAIVYKWKKNSCDYIMAIETYTKKKNPYPPKDNQWNICRAFNLNV